jgi:hypothetical protein
MRKVRWRWDTTDVIAWLIVGALGVAMVLSLLQILWQIGVIAVESPLFVAGYLAVVGVLYLAYRLFRTRGAGHLRQPAPPSAAPRFEVPRPVPPRARRAGTGENALILGTGVVTTGIGPFMVLDGWRHGFFGTVLMIMGTLTTLFGVLCLVTTAEQVRTRKRRAAEARAESSREPVRRYAARDDHRDAEGLRELLRELGRTDTAGPAALAELSTCPGLLDALSFRARRGELAVELRPFVDAVTVQATTPSEPPPDLTLASALASLDRDGHAREAAVTAMAAAPSPKNAWFLAERTTDPVEPVRLRALAAFELLISTDRQTYAPVLHRAVARLGGRRYAAALLALAGPQPAELPPTRCCRHWRDGPCLPVHRERAAEQARTDG